MKTGLLRKKALLWNLMAVLAVGLASATTQSSAGAAREQERITHEVRHELVMIPQLTIFDNLAYKVDGHTVTLIGQVKNPVIKDSAESAVKGIEGVEKVDNQIEVLPLSPNDDRIRLRVAHAIFNDSRLFRYSLGALPPIHIIVNRGHVTLEGVVDSQTDKNVAGIRTNGVSGVFSVANNLRVQSANAKK